MALITNAFSQKQLDDIYARKPTWVKPTQQPTTPKVPEAPSPKNTSATTTVLKKPEDPLKPVEGLSTEFQAAPTYTAGAGQTYEVTGNELVANQLNNLISKNNPYLQRARANAMNTANARGLLNSSMAAGSGEAAAIDAALQIAQQDASTYANRGQAREEGIIASQLQKQKDTNTAGLYGVQAGYESILSKQDAGQKSDLQRQIDEAALVRQTQGETHEQTLQREQLESQKELQRIQDEAELERQKLGVEAEIKVQQMNIDAEKYLQSVGITADAQAALIEHTRVMGQEYLVAYKAILMDPNMDSEESRATALKRLTDVYETNMDLVAAVAEVQTTTGANPNPDGSSTKTPASAITNRESLGINYTDIQPEEISKTGRELWDSTDTMTADVALEKLKHEIDVGVNGLPTKVMLELRNVDIAAAALAIEKGLSFYSGKRTFKSWVNLFNTYSSDRTNDK